MTLILSYRVYLSFLCPDSVDTEQVLKIKYLSQIDDIWFSIIDPIIVVQKTLNGSSSKEAVGIIQYLLDIVTDYRRSSYSFKSCRLF